MKKFNDGNYIQECNLDDYYINDAALFVLVSVLLLSPLLYFAVYILFCVSFLIMMIN